MTGPAVYLAPVSFGYGPAALAVAVARALHRRHPDLTVAAVADGLAWDLLTSSGAFPDDAVLKAPAGHLPGTASGTDAVWVGFADFDRIDRVIQLERTAIMVDPLWWMWHEPPALVHEGVRYLALRFPGMDTSAPSGAEGTFRVVPQVVETDGAGPSGEPRNGVLLNLGGAVAPGIDSLAYLQAVVDLVAAAGPDTDLLVATSSGIVEGLTAPVTAGTVAVRSLNRHEMLGALRERAVLVTVPGQSIIWEALTAAIPTIVLPGSNYSQHRQAVFYRSELRDVPVLTWDDLPGYQLAPAGMPEEQGLRHAAACGHRFAADRSARTAVQAWLSQALPTAVTPPSVTEGSAWSDLDGADVIADEIAAAAVATGTRRRAVTS